MRLHALELIDMSKKKPTDLEIIEERIKALDQRLSLAEETIESIGALELRLSSVEEKIERDLKDLQEYVYCVNIALLCDMDMVRLIGDYGQLTSGKVNFFDGIIKLTKEKEEVLRKLDDLYKIKGYKCEALEPKWIVGSIIALSRDWKITFESLSSYLIKKLGKKLAKKLVKKEIILEHYGGNALSIWESLFKES